MIFLVYDSDGVLLIAKVYSIVEYEIYYDYSLMYRIREKKDIEDYL